MQLRAIESDKVLRSLRRAGLSFKQASRLLNRALLCLNYIGEQGRRVSIEVFNCFNGEVRCKGRRLRFNQLLVEAELIRQTSPAIQGLWSSEYVSLGVAVEQTIKLTKSEAQIERKVGGVMRKKEKADQALQWLNQSLRHMFEGGSYLRVAKVPQWPKVDLQRALAGIVLEARRRAFRARYFRKLQTDSMVFLDNGEEGGIYRKAELEADFFQISDLAKYADDLRGKACSVGDLEQVDFRVGRLLKTEGFDFLKLRYVKNIVEDTVRLLKEAKVLCAVDQFHIHAEASEGLEVAFILAVRDTLDVDITLRDEPILTPLYINRLRLLYAEKHGIKLSDVPRVRPRYWKPQELVTESGRTVFKRKPIGRKDILLNTVQDAKDFYGIDPEAMEADAVTLYEARRQILQWGSVKASNADQACRELEDMLHALPIEPTRQQWELTDRGKQCLLDSKPMVKVAPASRGLDNGKSTASPLFERLTG